MSQALWSEVDRYIEETLVGHDQALVQALAASERAGLPAISVSAAQGKLLMLLIQMMGACRVLEIGTLGGYSAIWMARALPSQGKLISLEADPVCADVAWRNIERAGLAERVEIRVGPALDQMPQLEREAPFDFFFIDADKRNNPNYFAWALKLSRSGSVIVIDNVVREGAVIDASSSDPGVVGTRLLNEAIARSSGVSATTIQTVGVKGYDGFAVVRVERV